MRAIVVKRTKPVVRVTKDKTVEVVGTDTEVRVFGVTVYRRLIMTPRAEGIETGMDTFMCLR